jgi:hypothetical protein
MIANGKWEWILIDFGGTILGTAVKDWGHSEAYKGYSVTGLAIITQI